LKAHKIQAQTRLAIGKSLQKLVTLAEDTVILILIRRSLAVNIGTMHMAGL
jgi:hypothetical protein